MSSVRSIAVRRLEATLLAKLFPCSVKTGTPDQRASLAVVPAL